MKSFSFDGLILLTVQRQFLHVARANVVLRGNGFCPSLCSSSAIIISKTTLFLKMARMTTDELNSRSANH